MEIRLCHSFNAENKDMQEEEMGFTIRYLAAENARLALANKELNGKLESLSVEQYKERLCDVEIYGETVEQRLVRLEKTLNSERKEKWKAIEDSEKVRVDLVNCERDLALKDEEVKRIQNELSESQKIISAMKEMIERLKNREDTEDEPELHIRSKDNDMAEFKADLLAKRVIRQNALAAKSAEMQRLREELEKERLLRQNLQRQIETGEKVDASIAHSVTDEALRSENDRLRTKVQALDDEIRSLKSSVIQLKSDYKEEKRLHERTSKDKMTLQTENEEQAQMLKEMELEKERMWADYDREKIEVNKRTTALKDVVEISRQMLLIRETQVKELKKKLQEIEESVNNSKLPDQKNLREEYEKQLQNIKTLKELYEERVHLMEMERDKLNETISQHTKTIEGQKGEIESLREQCGNTNEELKKEKYQNDSLERDLRLSIAKSKDFENELSLMNNLFTQMLLGPYNTGNETDLDKLTELLQENHDLITELTLRENSSEIASALPKLLLDLITQVDGNGQLVQEQGREDVSEADTVSEQSESIAEGAVLPILSYKKAVVFEDPAEAEEESSDDSKTLLDAPKINENVNPAVQEIASNLPKVWRVLMELLSHHTVPDGPPPGDEKQCYKNVETPSGTTSVISVSNTFIRLKDLILEKKALQKELTRLKQLNSHLENRLDDQEKRLSHVQCELHKTWGIVGRMRAQHQQLHNHERILRYELQEKRVMLSELKQELEYCRDKWERARQKNNESETQWQKLRREFAARKNKSYLTQNLNDSGESGFSDEPNESGEEAENFDADRSSTQSPVDGKPERSREQSIEKIVEDPEEGTSSGAVSRAQLWDDERLRSREARLKRLEDQCELLVRRVDITTSKSNYLNNRLEELHEQYGSEARGQDAETDEVNDLAAPKDDSSVSRLSDRTEEATSCSSEPQIKPDASKQDRTMEERLNARSERLRRLEEQCQSLVGKMASTVQRGSDLSNKLEDLHVEYLNSEIASSVRQETRNDLPRTGEEESTADGGQAEGVRQQEDTSADAHGKEEEKTE
ncbi:UNVERIFIED_CONTAM: hypothetical protein PYX00_001574 [Menopon gallinae]